MKKKNKKNLIIILTVVLISLIIFAALLFTGIININQKQDVVVSPEPEIKTIENVQDGRQTWLDNKNINPDYVGEIVFDSNLINKPFVQAKDVYDYNGNLYHFYNEDGSLVENVDGYTGNDVYIWTNWKDMSYDYNIEGGSVFMDYRNELDDQNMIIYGHHFSEAGGNDPDRIKAFTPIEKLMDEDNYSNNKTLKLILDNETRSYELVGVYKFDINNNNHLVNLQYYRREYNYDEFEDIRDDNYYQNYIDTFNEVKLYDTGVKLTTDDRTLTLQTCISGLAGSVYEICVFKQTSIDYFD